MGRGAYGVARGGRGLVAGGSSSRAEDAEARGQHDDSDDGGDLHHERNLADARQDAFVGGRAVVFFAAATTGNRRRSRGRRRRGRRGRRRQRRRRRREGGGRGRDAERRRGRGQGVGRGEGAVARGLGLEGGLAVRRVYEITELVEARGLFRARRRRLPPIKTASLKADALGDAVVVQADGVLEGPGEAHARRRAGRAVGRGVQQVAVEGIRFGAVGAGAR
mmetsp:Transcript_20041/g.62019  ORF Transcript_20041/g.62019 Transcript_20041/m.62019 type:complete len:221 (-) Transcript_20041:1771-2433(-)